MALSCSTANTEGQKIVFFDINTPRILNESINLNEVAVVGWKKSHILDDIFDRPA